MDNKKNKAPECIKCQHVLDCKMIKANIGKNNCLQFEERSINLITGKKKGDR